MVQYSQKKITNVNDYQKRLHIDNSFSQIHTSMHIFNQILILDFQILAVMLECDY